MSEHVPVPPGMHGGGGPGDPLPQRAVWRYARPLVIACWGSLALGVVLVVVSGALDRSNSAGPVLLVAAVALICLFAALWVVLARKRRVMVLRKRRGLCLRCGYPRPYQQGGICTECGTVPWWDDHEAGRG